MSGNGSGLGEIRLLQSKMIWSLRSRLLSARLLRLTLRLSLWVPQLVDDIVHLSRGAVSEPYSDRAQIEEPSSNGSAILLLRLLRARSRRVDTLRSATLSLSLRVWR